MSRVGLNPITIEEGIQVTVEGNIVTVTGDGKELKISFPEILTVDVNDNVVQVNRKDDEKYSKSIHGTIRMIISNAIYGIKNGFEKKLELVGVGYRAKMEGTTLVMSLGLNHPVKFESPEGITIEVPEETKIVLKGYDKQKLGEVAAKIRATRKPEPYKGKGIRYEGEYVRRKSSKSGITA
ncbi:50S ribosomal protein L6 [candidate division WS6 bacterium RIFOXYB1_FULL_33_14]|uniref:Large ribosomal subunit protein uL6 n=1 Tax=candidate division WS6 bacterium RIFOXYB1_FULL_33_14 TaxID=1817896 RepID=A0A1F4UIC6_9BACT|nr:ribosomal protein L6 [uncultured bacterium]OGC44714.1 MAG: 50S ribosomal protein L6 [candidate division WS6 bacterium RIFOXYB1_FULL_33_14]